MSNGLVETGISDIDHDYESLGGLTKSVERLRGVRPSAVPAEAMGSTTGLVWSATAAAVDGWIYQGVADTYLLDEALRDRMATLNPHATAAIAGRLLEANNRGFWDADPATLEQIKEIYADLEDRLEGVR